MAWWRESLNSSPSDSLLQPALRTTDLTILGFGPSNGDGRTYFAVLLWDSVKINNRCIKAMITICHFLVWKDSMPRALNQIYEGLEDTVSLL